MKIKGEVYRIEGKHEIILGRGAYVSLGITKRGEQSWYSLDLEEAFEMLFALQCLFTNKLPPVVSVEVEDDYSLNRDLDEELRRDSLELDEEGD